MGKEEVLINNLLFMKDLKRYGKDERQLDSFVDDGTGKTERNIASQHWNGGQKGEEDRVDQKHYGGGWLKFKGHNWVGVMGKCQNPRNKS